MAKDKKKKEKTAKVKKQSNRLTLFLSIQLVVIVLCTTALGSVIHFVNAPEIADKTLENKLNILSGSAQALLSRTISSTQEQLKQLTIDDDIHNAISLQDLATLKELENKYLSNFAYAESLRIFPWTDLGTAGIKKLGLTLNSIEGMMVTKAVKSEDGLTEVYKAEQWQISFASPVSQDGKTIGVLVLTLSNDFLKDALKQNIFTDNGKIDISQNKKKVFSFGQGSQVLSTEVKAPFIGGKINISLKDSIKNNIEKQFIAVYTVIGIAGAIIIIALVVLAGLTRKSIKGDIEKLQQYIKQSKGLHEVKAPSFDNKDFLTLFQEIETTMAQAPKASVNESKDSVSKAASDASTCKHPCRRC